MYYVVVDRRLVVVVKVRTFFRWHFWAHKNVGGGIFFV